MSNQTGVNKFSLDIAKISGIQSIEDHDAESLSGGQSYNFGVTKLDPSEQIIGGKTKTIFGRSSTTVNTDHTAFLAVYNVKNFPRQLAIYYPAKGNEGPKVETFGIDPGQERLVNAREGYDAVGIGLAKDEKYATRIAKGASTIKRIADFLS